MHSPWRANVEWTLQVVVAEGETENSVSSIIVAACPACSLDIYTLVALCPYIGTRHFPCSLTGSLFPRKWDEEEGFGMHSEFGCMVHQVKIISCPLEIPLFSILLDIFSTSHWFYNVAFQSLLLARFESLTWFFFCIWRRRLKNLFVSSSVVLLHLL